MFERNEGLIVNGPFYSACLSLAVMPFTNPNAFLEAPTSLPAFFTFLKMTFVPFGNSIIRSCSAAACVIHTVQLINRILFLSPSQKPE